MTTVRAKWFVLFADGVDRADTVAAANKVSEWWRTVAMLRLIEQK